MHIKQMGFHWELCQGGVYFVIFIHFSKSQNNVPKSGGSEQFPKKSHYNDNDARIACTFILHITKSVTLKTFRSVECATRAT